MRDTHYRYTPIGYAYCVRFPLSSARCFPPTCTHVRPPLFSSATTNKLQPAAQDARMQTITLPRRRANDAPGRCLVEQHAAIDPDDPAWAACPQSGVPGQPLDVDIRFCVQRVANVDTVSASATAHIVVMFYWSDTRLVGCPGGGQGAAFKTLDAAARLGKLAGKKRRRLHAARADRQGHGPDQACADCRRDGGQPDRRWSS